MPRMLYARVHLKTPFAVERKRRCASVAASNISMAHILWRLYIPLYEALLIGMAVLIYIISAFHILLMS